MQQRLHEHSEVGLSLGPLLGPEQILRIGSAADLNANVHSLWIPESWGRESFATLGALSQVTKRVLLGSSIVNVYSRSAAGIAMGAATVDALSRGRMILGLGSSTESIVSDWHGQAFSKPLTRVREYVESIRLTISGERANYNGSIVKIKNFRLLNGPFRQPVPIYLAAVNENMLKLATQIGDGVLLYLRPYHELDGTIRGISARAGAKPFEICFSIICAVSETDPEKARRRASQTLGFYVAVGKYYAAHLSQAGFEKEVKEITLAYRHGGASAAGEAVSRHMLDSLTISGSKRDCIQSLQKFMNTGITLPILQFNPVEGDEGSFMEFISSLS